ncbi:MAG: undecaprenyl-diphosphate phosphatase [Cyanobacteria bacterium SZAS LIN-3]|nr:undecaprenyl-diphosphate phosphatase [Cyanobacteria bacterium SZAS LIN-3]
MAHPVITLVEAVVLGVVQGLTEFLPISSTAHLRVVPALFHWDDPGTAFSAVIQLGSVVAVLAYFYKDILEIGGGALRGIKAQDFGCRDVRLAGAIVIGTIPVCVLGLLLKGLLEQDGSPLRGLPVVGVASIGMGLLLLLAEKLAKHQRSIDDMGARDGFFVGLGQAMALIPGCSRSGSTLTAALFMGMKRADAARFSFLLGIPAVTLSGLLELYHLYKEGMQDVSVTSLALGLVASLVVSYLAIAWLMKYLQTHSTWLFVIYRLIFGITVLVLSSMGIIG